jgi:hypothetical protein
MLKRVIFFFLSFETGSQYVVQAGLELMILRLLASEC